MAARKALAFDRHLRDAADLGRRLDADQLEQGRRQVAGVGELVAQLAPGGDAASARS